MSKKSKKIMEYKLYYSMPEQPLPVTQEMCTKTFQGIKEKTGELCEFILQKNIISDTELYILNYLNSALEVLKNCKGFSKHISEYKNDFESTFFVTLIADILSAQGFVIEFEPDILGQDKKPDIYCYQKEDNIAIYFECKQPKEDTKKYLKEQRKIFDGIENAISDEYSLALFYDRELSNDEIKTLYNQIVKSLKNNKEIYENRIIVDDRDLGVKLCISGTQKNIEKNSLLEVTGIPNFSNTKGFSLANGINKYGKNIVFYKSYSKNTINAQLKNSKDKVQNGTPYVICIDISDSRFGVAECAEYIKNHFKNGHYSNFSGVLLIEHGLLDDSSGTYHVQTYYIENTLSKIKLPSLKILSNRSYALNIKKRCDFLNQK